MGGIPPQPGSASCLARRRRRRPAALAFYGVPGENRPRGRGVFFRLHGGPFLTRWGRFYWRPGRVERFKAIKYPVRAVCYFTRAIVNFPRFILTNRVGISRFTMAQGYLPQPLPAFLAWILNFSGLITANPTLYGLVAGDAVVIQTASDDFSAAYAISTAPATRTEVTVQTTITARNTAVQIVRGYARIILANAGVADAEKLALGLKLRDTVNTKIPTPATNPVISILGATPGQLTCRYHDSAQSALVKAKPFGASQLQLFVLFGTVAPVTPGATPFYGVVTKAPFVINCPDGSAGQRAYIYGRWITQKGLTGPYSPLAQAAIM